MQHPTFHADSLQRQREATDQAAEEMENQVRSLQSLFEELNIPIDEDLGALVSKSYPASHRCPVHGCPVLPCCEEE